MLGSSLSLTLAPSAQAPWAVQIRSRRICHCEGRMPKRTSPSAMARRVRAGNGPNQPGGFVHTSLSARYEKGPDGAPTQHREGYARLIPEPNPREQRSGQPFGCPNSFPTNLSTPEVSSTPLSPPDTTKALTEIQPNIERDMLGSSLSLTLASSARASRSAVQIRSRRICRPRRFRPHLSLRQIRKRP